MRVAEERYRGAPDFPAYVDAARKHVEFWRGVHRTAFIPDDLLRRAEAIGGRWHLLALSEDWCGDAVNTIPVIARLAEIVPAMELRILGRDANPDLMAAHLSAGTRSIPVVMAFDAAFEERGWWGPRPAPLQFWLRSEGCHLAKDERYKRTRSWYAHDRGRTTIEEVLAMLEQGARTMPERSASTARGPDDAPARAP